jgi:hypothetical protein
MKNKKPLYYGTLLLVVVAIVGAYLIFQSSPVSFCKEYYDQNVCNHNFELEPILIPGKVEDIEPGSDVPPPTPSLESRWHLTVIYGDRELFDEWVTIEPFKEKVVKINKHPVKTVRVYDDLEGSIWLRIGYTDKSDSFLEFHMEEDLKELPAEKTDVKGVRYIFTEGKVSKSHPFGD